jgi:hypothetical protein
LFNLAITLGIAILAIAFSLFSILISYGGQIVLAYLAGEWLSKKFLPQVANPYLWLLLGVVLYAIVAAIPLLGWVASIAATLVGVGAMWLTWREWREAEAAL